jgi:ferrous iron transport protein B
MRMNEALNSSSAPACCEPSPPHPVPHHAFTVALVGNPNAGKTTLFNALTGLRAKTANFPGTTVERRVGRVRLGEKQIVLVDLPGLYSLESSSPEEKIASDALRGRLENHPAPNAALVVADATNLERNLFLVSQVLELDCPVIVALNMMDMARREGIHIDVAKLRAELGCPVIPISARSGLGLAELKQELERLATGKKSAVAAHPKPACALGCAGCPYQARYEWTEKISMRVMNAAEARRSARTEKLDEIFTHPVAGVVVFQIVMICILFFALSLLEDTGYLARAALVMDRIMRRLGLPGKAFVPMLSAHACAIPAIMATRVIENPRDRLVTILITPLLTCSARIPVYAMVTALLFPHSPFKAALVFTGAYATGALAAVGAALVFNRTILPGGSRPLLIELPPYRLPSLQTALLTTFDRAKIFVKQAGTIILLASLVLWGLSHYPHSPPPPAAVALEQQAGQLDQTGQTSAAAQLRVEADHLTQQSALQNSAAGRIGRFIEPVLRPLGYDWQIGIGILSSFAAREVIVSTLAIVYGVGQDAAEHHSASLYDSLRHATRSDGTPMFTTATCASLLVYYILAAQCLSTTAVVRRETGGWKWPLFQIFYMTGLAYVCAFLVYQVVSRLAG